MRFRTSIGRAVALLPLLALGLSGCNHAKAHIVSSLKTATSTTPAITEVVTALVNNKSAALDAAAAHAAASSPAAAYLKANAFATMASEQVHAFQGGPAATVTPEPNAAFKVCFPVQNASPMCDTYSRFITNSAGAVTSFSINGASIDGNAKLATATAMTVSGATYQLRSMLKRPDGAIVVTVTVTAGSSALTLNAKQAELASGDGLTQTADDAIAPVQVKPSATSTFLMLFPPASVDGQLTLAPCRGTCSTNDHVVLPMA